MIGKNIIKETRNEEKGNKAAVVIRSGIAVQLYSEN